METVARLVEQFQPTRYTLHLAPNKETMTFSGNVAIVGSLPNRTSIVRLHAKGLTIRSAKINNISVGIRLDDELTELILDAGIRELSSMIEIDITFDGAITKAMHGMYPCFAKNGDILLATQFESHHAREVFPCIDEPAAKATFDLTLTHPTGDVALSNMPATTQTTEANSTVTTFATTPKMSTYLLAFVTGNMQAVHGKTKNDTDIAVWSTIDQPVEALQFALQTAIDCTEFFNEYFDTPYPLPKCDHVALPDFSSGAMENWGLITYREVCLLVDPQTTSQSTKEFAATVIAHEISHQWFGNLVTMAWWDDLWLNESFASLMENIAVNHLYPEWDIMLTFASQDALSALWRDSIEGVQAVKTDVHHPDEISTLFDPSIVYAKGARLLNMVWTYVGDQAFRDGLKYYFSQHAYSNTHGADLWTALSKASGKDVAHFMQTWLTTSNFPLVRVEHDGTILRLSQHRFTSAGLQEASERIIPLSALPHLQVESLEAAHLELEMPQQFVQLNTAGGHYSVQYINPDYRVALREAARGQTMQPVPRLLLLNDALMQTRAGLTPIDEPLGLLEAYVDEQLEPVWSVVSLVLGDARRLAEELPKDEPLLKSFAGSLIQTQYERLGWEKKPHEPQNDTKLRELILSLAVYSEQPAVISDALSRYASPFDLAADTRSIILATAVRNGTAFDELLELHPTVTDPEIQQDIAGALCATRSLKQATQLLARLQDPQFVRLQDIDRFVVYLLRNSKTRSAAWQWLKDSWSWIETNFAGDKSFDNYPRYAAGSFSTTDQLTQFEAFFGPMKTVTALKRSIELGETEISMRVAWREREEKHLHTWLVNQSKIKK